MTRPEKVRGPDGRMMTLDDLPSPSTKRWVARNKAEVVMAVRGGLLTLGEACERYRISIEEYLEWSRAIDHQGLLALRTTRLKQYR